MGAQLGKRALEETTTGATSAIILAWHRPQGMSKVVCLPVIEAGPIRDGPMQSQELRSVMLRDNLREAT